MVAFQADDPSVGFAQPLQPLQHRLRIGPAVDIIAEMDQPVVGRRLRRQIGFDPAVELFEKAVAAMHVPNRVKADAVRRPRFAQLHAPSPEPVSRSESETMLPRQISPLLEHPC